ncbi:MAG TPA: leucine--tRNA ligase [Bacteroidales bacterium]|jgi:leucyl-tRNA synthetase|nr:leucine--tRNA ligase [Bacteroidales bacterium]HOF45950.1 leucine--tRNA ligase [Bacteroidales bacterium]HOS57055.1 leucine--tRNA ligase [Bacteroidales bacterium]
MEYNFRKIEEKWQKVWKETEVYKTDVNFSKPKFYILDMFPYPSGAGLHVGHPLGYIASDIFARYKRQKGFNVLHPMGYDSFGLPAEQYAIQTGEHPAISTERNIKRYRSQLDRLGFSFDWNREFKTSDPSYYRWTQWTFIQLFHHYYCNDLQKAKPIADLISHFEKHGTEQLNVASTNLLNFTSEEWKEFSENEKQNVLLNYRLAYIAETWVNWCPKLGCVLANDEVVNCLSVRGGFAVERKLMKQWILRVSAYADRLLEGLNKLQWNDSIKEIQRNWIGRSEGAFIQFPIQNSELTVDVFTTRPDTIFGVSYMALCPEHSLIDKITTQERKDEVAQFLSEVINLSEVERAAEAKKIRGVFTGAYVIHPFTNEPIPIWIADYVLAGYGTGAIMAVPAHDSRDYAFAKYFNLPIKEVIAGGDITKEAFEAKEGICVNSSFIDGKNVYDGGKAVIDKIIEKKIGHGTVNYRLRDAIFSRQRYWGEPFPIYYKDGVPYTLDEEELPLTLPQVDKFLPTEQGEPPLARAENWKTKDGYPLETCTMPGFAGSSGYYLRYMDPHNNDEYFSKEANEYWQNVDVYVGGAEHATGHLIYARFWNKFLFDIGLCCRDEPFEKLINQGMIQGRSNFVYKIIGTNTFVSYGEKDKYSVIPLHVDVNLVKNDRLNIEKFKQWQPEFANAEFILENGKYICGWEMEKMSKSKFNVQNPDDLVEKYGADTLRMYEMFLGPIELSKPWDTNGIEGVHRFLKKFWRLFHQNDNSEFYLSTDKPSAQELKILHKTIKKVQDDNERFSFNTAVSTFMIATNELLDLQCNKRDILLPLAILLSAYAPHITEELWHLAGNKNSIVDANYPIFDASCVEETSHIYPISFNGKTRLQREFSVQLTQKELEALVLADAEVQKWLDNKTPKRIIIVPKKIINIVV